MERTRGAVLDGAVRAVEKHGARKTTMADIANLAGIAKGTLYNHFRTKEAVYVAALDNGVRGLGDECTAVARDDLCDALSLAADRIGSHPALRRIATDEPAAVSVVTCVGTDGVWAVARAGVRSMLEAAGRDPTDAAVDLVLRWLVTCVASPGPGVEQQAALLAATLPRATRGSAPDQPPAAP
jgi:AcrR family transcriptional regulator